MRTGLILLVLSLALTCGALPVLVPEDQPASVITNGTHTVVVWWHAYPSYRIEWSPDGFAWMTLVIGSTSNPELPQVLVDNGTGMWWAFKFYRMVDTTNG